MAIRFLYNETQNFEICTQTAICFSDEIENFQSCTQAANSYFPQGNTKANYL